MSGQMALDLDYDERSVKLAGQIAIMMAPHLATGTKAEVAKALAARISMLATRTLKYEWEPQEPIRCHLCSEQTEPKFRVRVVVCPRCSAEPRVPGSTG
jgi:hypothetical protein